MSNDTRERVEESKARRTPTLEPLMGGMRGKSALLVGFLLMALSVGFCYIAWGPLPTDSKRPNVSPELFTGIGVSMFGLPGLFLFLFGLVDSWRIAQARRGEAFYPNEPWQWDYRWNSQSAPDIQWWQHRKALVGLLVGTCIMVPFHWLAIEEEFPWFVLAGLVFFDLLVLCGIVTMMTRIARDLFHGGSQVQYTQFPMRLGETAELTLKSAGRLEDLRDLHATLFCVQEETITTGHGNKQTTRCVARALYSAGQELDVSSISNLGGSEISVQFQLPSTPEWSSELSAMKPRYWLLHVEGDRPGLNFEKRFLLPVYA